MKLRLAAWQGAVSMVMVSVMRCQKGAIAAGIPARGTKASPTRRSRNRAGG